MKLIWTSFKKYRFAFLFLFYPIFIRDRDWFSFLFKTRTYYKRNDSSIFIAFISRKCLYFKKLALSFSCLTRFNCPFFLFSCGARIYLLSFFEGISIGFVLPIFFSLYKINGLFYFLLYFLFVKVIYLLLLFFLFLKIVRFVKKYVEGLRLRKYIFMEEMKYIFIVVFMILINDFVVYFGSNQVLSLLLG